MPNAGRLTYLKKNGVTILGGRVISFSVEGSEVDTSNQGDSGFFTSLDGVVIGARINFTIQGIEIDNVLRDIALSATQAARFLTDMTLETADGDVLAANMFLMSYSESADHTEAVTYDATLATRGAWTHTKAA